MNLVSNIILLFVCIGVTYSSPTSNSSSDAAHGVKHPAIVPEVQPDHNKVQTTPATQTLQPVPSTISTIASSSVKIDEPVTVKDKTKLPVVVGNKNVTSEDKNTSMSDVIPKQNTTSSNSSSLAPVQTTTSAQGSTINTTAATSTTPTTPFSTAAPVVSISDHAIPTPSAQERQFDGPSFVGGIVLTVGLTAIGFIAFKFYKSGKIERNYRTL